MNKLLRAVVMAVFLGGLMVMLQASLGQAQDTAPLGPQAAKELMDSHKNDPNFIILDVRTPQEYASGHIAGARLLDFNAPDFAVQAAKLPKDAGYLVYCRSGKRSAKATAVLRAQGYADVTDMGGIKAWQEAGFAVHTGAAAGE